MTRRKSAKIMAVGTAFAIALSACGGNSAPSATVDPDTAGAVHDDTGVVTSEVPAAGTDLDELRDLAFNLSPEEFVSSLTTEEIEAVGGDACALELAAISLALSRWSVDHPGVAPTSLDDVADDPRLAGLKLWTLDDTTVEAVDGSGCIGPFPVL